MDAGEGELAVRHPRSPGFRTAARRAAGSRRRPRLLDRSGEPLQTWDRRGGLRSRRRRAGARRRRVRHHRRSRDGAGDVRGGARLMEAEIVQRFLESVGAKADIDLYLKLFRSQRKESCAILAPNAQIVKSALDPVHFDLRILAGLGLLPVVLLGLFEPKDADAQGTRVSDWLLEDAVPCELIRADLEMSAATVEVIRAVIARGAIPLVSVEAAAALSIDARFRLL